MDTNLNTGDFSSRSASRRAAPARISRPTTQPATRARSWYTRSATSWCISTSPLEDKNQLSKVTQEPSTLTCDKLDIDGTRKTYVANGHVHFTQASRDATADHGTLDDVSNELHLYGNVHIRDKDQYLDADDVVYNTKTGDVRATGNPVMVRAPASTPVPAGLLRRRPVRRRRRGNGNGPMTPRRDAGPGLFGDAPVEPNAQSRAPLAARMRPRTLDEFVGQEHLVGEGRALRRAIEGDALPSMILWGPPGTGKTTLAEVIAKSTGAQFVALSAVSAGVADLRAVVADARRARAAGQRTVLFIDEIHRFNKAQQDAVLPYVEDGTVTLIGATTENPSFEVNSALLSRARVFVLRALADEEVATHRSPRAGRPRARPRRRRRRDRRRRARRAGRTWPTATRASRSARSSSRQRLRRRAERRRRRIDEATDRRRVAAPRCVPTTRAATRTTTSISAFIKSIRGSDPGRGASTGSRA